MITNLFQYFFNYLCFECPCFILISERKVTSSNQLRKTNKKREYEKTILTTLKNWTGKDKRWSVWISSHLYVDFNLGVCDIEQDCLQVFFIGEDRPPFMLTLYDPVHDVSDDSRADMEERMHKFSHVLADALSSQLHSICKIDLTILSLTLSKQQWKDGNLEEKMDTIHGGAVPLTRVMYQDIEFATTALIGVSYVPYILSKYKVRPSFLYLNNQTHVVHIDCSFIHSCWLEHPFHGTLLVG